MLLILDDEAKTHLQFLNRVEPNVAAEFCRISTEFLLKGTNPKVYQSAAQKLQVEPDVVRHTIQGIMHLLTEAAKQMLSKPEFQDSLTMLGLPAVVHQDLVQWHIGHHKEVQTLMSQSGMQLPHYSNLEWRLDVQLASRCLHRQITPSVTLRLEVEEDGKKRPILLQTDVVNLVHMTEVLDRALQEAKSHHSRRIMRCIK